LVGLGDSSSGAPTREFVFSVVPAAAMLSTAACCAARQTSTPWDCGSTPSGTAAISSSKSRQLTLCAVYALSSALTARHGAL
jgi:hypothetical protein